MDNNKFYLLQHREDENLFVRKFPSGETVTVFKVLMGSLLELCLIDGLENDLDSISKYVQSLIPQTMPMAVFGLEGLADRAFSE